MSLIVAVDKEWEIGKDNGLLVHLPEDMKYFREATGGRTVAVGRRTLESFPGGRPLKNCVDMVLSRDESYSPEGMQIYHRTENVLKALRGCNEDDVLIIGGGIIYREFLLYYNKMCVTYTHGTFKVDTDFESLDQDESWKLESVNDGRGRGGISFEFKIYRRVR